MGVNLSTGSQPSGTSHEPGTTGLDSRRIGTVALVFMIIAASAPLTVVAGGAPSNFAVTGLLGIPLFGIIVSIVINFNVLIGLEGTSVLSWLLPAIVLVPGLFGTVWALVLRSSRPRLYAGMGTGGSLG